MAKLTNYKGSVPIASGLTQVNNKDFPLVEANAVQVDNIGNRLDKVLAELDNRIDALSTGQGGSSVAHEYIYEFTKTSWFQLPYTNKCYIDIPDEKLPSYFARPYVAACYSKNTIQSNDIYSEVIVGVNRFEALGMTRIIIDCNTDNDKFDGFLLIKYKGDKN